jgi:hypothetical protein
VSGNSSRDKDSYILEGNITQGLLYENITLNTDILKIRIRTACRKEAKVSETDDSTGLGVGLILKKGTI